jgi:ribose transport system substrate-binding protein
MDQQNDLHEYIRRLEEQAAELRDGKPEPMPRRDFLRMGALAGAGVALAATTRFSPATSSSTVHGYFGTFKNLTGDRYGWPSLEHDPINDSLWTAQQRTAALDHTGIKFANVDANDSQATQVQNALDFIGQGYNGIYINTGTPAGWAEVIKQANASHCYTMNHSPDPFTGATQNVVIDHAEAGYVNAQAAAKWLKQNAGGKGAAVTLAILNSVPLKLRTDTFKAELKRLVPGITIYPDVAVPLNEADPAVAGAQNVLTAHPDINIMFPYNDETSVPVAKALAQEGIKEPTKFWLGGVDGSTLALQAIATGTSTLQATAAFLFNYSAAYLMKDLETVLSGGKIYPTRALLPLLVTKSNASQILADSNGFLEPKYRHLYAQLMHYFSTPLTTGGPLPSVVKSI